MDRASSGWGKTQETEMGCEKQKGNDTVNLKYHHLFEQNK